MADLQVEDTLSDDAALAATATIAEELLQRASLTARAPLADTSPLPGQAAQAGKAQLSARVAGRADATATGEAAWTTVAPWQDEPLGAPDVAAALSGAVTHDRMNGAIEMIRMLPGNRGMEILRKVVDIYLTSTPTLLQTMREAESGGDAEKLKAAAHSFKSSSANLGAMKLARVCRELETLGRQGSTEGALPLLMRVEEEYRVVRDALQGGHLC